MEEEQKAEATFRQAIGTMERARLDYSVAERAAVFRTSGIREFYWGMIRVAARRAHRSNSEDDFIAALQASDSLRARQLGDLLAPGENLTAEAISEFRKGLSPDEAVLIYTAMDQHLVLPAFTADRRLAHISDHDGKAFSNDIVALARDLARSETAISALEPRLVRLGTKLLAPARALISDKKKLLVLSDSALNAIPFDVLSLDDEPYRPLLADYAVRGAPSLKLLLHRRQLKPSAKGLFAVGDPVYARSPVMPDATPGAEHSSTRSSRYLDYFNPLPETQAEVKAVASTFKGEPIELVVGSKAKESLLKRANLRRYRHLHFATHGVLGGEVPGLAEPAIVLGQERGEDGFLTASEVEALRLDADLTVLSACSTGSGQHFEGEGVMSMSRAFTMAGSRSMIVSLWPVPSKETASLMVSFYRKLRGRIPAADALRLAKLEFLVQAKENTAAVGVAEGTSHVSQRGLPIPLGTPPDAGSARDESAAGRTHPFYWAAFVLFGG